MTITVDHLSFTYRKDKPLLRDISFSVREGERVAVLGANGAGKTTLLRCLMGFVKPDSGRCLLDGKDIRTVPPKTFWQTVAYVPQLRGSFAGYTAREMILLGRTPHIGTFAMPSKSDHAKVEEVASRLGITPLLDKAGGKMSGGEWQMVLIARALVAEPKLIILDEPEAGLDFRNQLIILDTLSALSRDGIGCIFNTHNPDHALSHADKALLIQKNTPALFGDADTVITAQNIERTFGVRTAVSDIQAGNGTRKTVVPLSVI